MSDGPEKADPEGSATRQAIRCEVAAEALRALNKELHQQGIALKFAHTNRPLRKVLERIGFTSEIGRESIFHSVHEAAEAFQKS